MARISKENSDKNNNANGGHDALETSSFFAPLYPWQSHAWQQLIKRYPQLPHGLLLAGQEGIGKKRFAYHFVAWLLCDNKQDDTACGTCTSCLWLKSGYHPNFMPISREVNDKGKLSKQIRIEQIRALQPFVQQTSQGYRIVIIEDAECLNIAAANALLKTLEEPAPQVILLLLTHYPMQLPATIRSRLQQIPLKCSDIDAQAFLHHQQQITPADAAILLAQTENAPLKALALYQSKAYGLRALWLKDWFALINHQKILFSVANEWQKKLSIEEWLDMFAALLQDLVRAHLNMPVLQTDLDFKALQAHTELSQLLAVQVQLTLITQSLAQNIQPALLFDRLMADLLGL